MMRTNTLGLAVGAALLLGMVASPAQAASGPTDCAEARAKIRGIQGWVSPNACTFIKKQIKFGGMVGDPARVDTYVSIFSAEATLWEPGRLMTGKDTIRASITNTLKLDPDFRFHGTRVAVNGPAVMFEASNTITLLKKEITYPAIYRVQVADDGEVVQGRRYYDRAEWFLPFDSTLAKPFADVVDSGNTDYAYQPTLGPDEIAARAAAWNGEDAEALVATTKGARLTGPGLSGRELRTKQGKLAYLKRFFDQVNNLKLKPGQTIRAEGATYAEWHGTADAHGETVSFGLIERIGDSRGTSSDWSLSFDQLPLIANAEKIGKLYALVSQPATP